MILSHAQKYIFLKNKKVAGSTVEFYLSRFSGPDDIVTQIGSEPERIPPSLRYLFGRDTRFQNSAGYKNHMGGTRVRAKIPTEVWDTYFKFCIEREPLSKTVSAFHFKTWQISDKGDAVSTFLDYAFPNFYSDIFRYFENGKLIADKVVNFSRLTEDMTDVCTRLKIPFEGDFGFKSKSFQKQKSHQSLNLTEELKQEFADGYALEAEILPFMKIAGCSPSSPAVLPWNEARVARLQDDFETGLKHVNRALRRDKDYVPAIREKALILSKAGEAERAIKLITRASEAAPERTRYLIDLAQISASAGDTDKAERAFRDAIALSPKNPQLRTDFSNFLAANGQSDLAAKEATSILPLIEPDLNEHFKTRLNRLVWNKQFKKALDLIDAQTLEPEDGTSFEPPPGTVSHVRKLRWRESVGLNMLRAGDLEGAGKILLSEELFIADKGNGFAKFMETAAQSASASETEDLIGQGLSWNPTGTNFYNTAIELLVDSQNLQLIDQLCSIAQEQCGHISGLMARCARLRKKASARGSSVTPN
ncbi:hypothetical protein [Ponticaulis sp.]|uniref:hypothetical protein n=1 Tax=Ponticaulis sp. TaxID=2020902 RepID=UPI000B6E6144|nr:hypothetical protein [Ponticaulis sp.]MAI89177.1 hypothetical protein [Ponticaulis sp.]OUY01171.1 MAG: hypothetical protein CBB65_01670 [Hyphomonadaceae bacterium TMED5]|tara:strand:- start:89795 stop:91399 length:1605 start_codon:yes stop_codon:yes gene_type:complete